MAEPVVVSLRDVRKSFNIGTPVETEVLHGIDLELHRGEFCAVVGPSGSGKSTLLNLIGLLDRPTSGTLAVCGEETTGLDDAALTRLRGHSIGFVFQYHHLLSAFSAVENVVLPMLGAAGRPDQRMFERADRLLADVGLAAWRDHPANRLSGGQQQRVALGRALVAQPDVLLLDEPLSNLDAKLRDQMRAELKRIQREVGVPILYVTHDQDEALSMSDRIAVMNAGKIHQIAAPTVIYEQPATKFVLDFIGAVNYFDAEVLSESGGTLTLGVAGDQRLKVPTPAEMPVGKEILVAVRPEDLRVTPGEGLAAQVELRSFRGSICDYRLKVGAQELWLQTEKTTLIPEGSTVTLEATRAFFLEKDARHDLDAKVYN